MTTKRERDEWRKLAEKAALRFDEDADSFVVAARTAVPALLDEVERLTRERIIHRIVWLCAGLPEARLLELAEVATALAEECGVAGKDTPAGAPTVLGPGAAIQEVTGGSG